MPLYRHHDRAILLVHIPKTGGSSLEEILVHAGAAQALKFHKRLGFSASTPQHMQWDVLQRWVPDGFYDYSLTIVRNPFDRLASEYAWRARVSGKPIVAFNPWVRKTLKRYDQNPYIHDNHIRPQVDFVGPDVVVFKLEDGLDPVAKTAFDQLGLEYSAPQMPHVRKSTHQLIEIEQATLGLVRAFYAADFATYGYDPDVVPAHLFAVVPDPAPPPPPPGWRIIASKVKRRLMAATKSVEK